MEKNDLLETWQGRPRGSASNTEKKWDDRAASFYEGQLRDNGHYPSSINFILRERGLLGEGKDILEIGSGTGRYTFPIAEGSASFLATDISSEMLSYIEQRASSESWMNMRCEKLNWDQVDLEERGWIDNFDLVFGVMCPATRSREALIKMSSASRGYCLLGQYINWVGPEPGKSSGGYDPHNDRDSLAAYFHILWEEGYNPEVFYLTSPEDSEIESVLAFVLWKCK